MQVIEEKNHVLRQISADLMNLQENLEGEKQRIQTEMLQKTKDIRTLKRKNKLLTEKLLSNVICGTASKDKNSTAKIDKDDSGRESDTADTYPGPGDPDGEAGPGLRPRPLLGPHAEQGTNITQHKTIICYLTCHL